MSSETQSERAGEPTRHELEVVGALNAHDRESLELELRQLAKRHGLIAHRWYGTDGQYMAVDEWPDADSFNAFFNEAQPEISPVMQAAGVTSPPDVTFWRTLDTGDAVGWGA